MDDLQYGTRNKRGDWQPKEPLSIAPFYKFPWKPKEIAGFIWGYFVPWNIAWMILATVYWYYLTPSIETLKTFSPGWIGLLFLRNAASVLIFFGAMELRLYIKRSQGNLFKYNHRWPADNKSDVFMFKSQTLDGAITSLTVRAPPNVSDVPKLATCWVGWRFSPS